MKRFLALFLVVLLGLTALTGCGGETAPEGEASGEDLSLQKVLDQGVITCAVSPDYAPYEYLDLVNKTNWHTYIEENIWISLLPKIRRCRAPAKDF